VTFWPVVWFMFLIYVVGPTFVRPDGTYPLWGYNLIGVLGNGAELIAALAILRREGYRLTPKALRERINLRFPDKVWKWGASVGAFVVAVGLVLLAVPLEAKIATVLPPPGWMPDHPLHEVSTLREPSTDSHLIGKVLSWIYQFVVVGLIANYIGEGLYYRAALQPKLRGVSAVVLWPLGALIRRLRKRDREPNPTWRRTVWVGWVVSGLNLVFLLVLLLSFGEEWVFGVPLLIRVILVIPIITSILSVVFLVLTVIAWMQGYWSLVGRLYYSLIASASALFVLFAG
jgi:hypothetical protein